MDWDGEEVKRDDGEGRRRGKDDVDETGGGFFGAKRPLANQSCYQLSTGY
jgi:hypothetical protein